MRVPGDDKVNYPTFWFDPDDHKDEPAFVVVPEEGGIGLVTLGWMLGEMHDWHTEGREPTWTYLAIYNPTDGSVLPCVPLIKPLPGSGADGRPYVHFTSEGPTVAVAL